MAAAHDRRQLGRLMVEEGFLGDEELARALEEQERTGRPLGKILVELGFVSAGAVANALAEQHGGLLKTEYGISAGLHAADAAPVQDPAAETLALIEQLEAQIDAAVAEREVLIQRIEELQRALAARPETAPEQEAAPAPERSHLIFMPSASGYSLFSADGPAPPPRTVLGSGDGARYEVTRVGPSPLPGRPERCAYLQLVSPEAEPAPERPSAPPA